MIPIYRLGPLLLLSESVFCPKLVATVCGLPNPNREHLGSSYLAGMGEIVVNIS
jgi:hypothetical protein